MIDEQTTNSNSIQLGQDLPVLSDDIIERYQKAFKKGRRHFLDKIVLHNMKLVIYLAHQYHPPVGYDYNDLIMAGTPGLYVAARRWKNGKGASFGTYAALYIKNGMRRFIQKNSHAVSVPYRFNDELSSAYHEKHELEKQLGHVVSNDDSRLSKSTVRSLSRICSRVDLDAPGEDGECMEIPEQIESPVYGEEEYEIINKLLNQMDHRVSDILRARFGFEKDRDHLPTLDELGKEWHITRERVRQLENKGLFELKRRLKMLKSKYNLQLI